MGYNYKNTLFFVNILAATLIVCVLSGCMGNSKPTKKVGESEVIGIERFDELETIGRVAPRRSKDIKDSRWGLEFNLRTSDDIDTMLEKIAASGVKWGRVRTAYGYDVTPAEGYYDWEKLDRIINGLVEHEIKVFITINNRGVDLNESNSDGDTLTDNKELEEYLDAVAAIVKRYDNIVKHWEIFNEPDVTPVYNKVVREASKVIKQIDSEAKVLAGSLERGGGFVKQIENLLNGTGSYIDIITFHAYNEFPEALKHHWVVPTTGAENGGYIDASMLFKDIREQVKRVSHPIEIWQGEAGYPSSEHTRSWKGRGPWGENVQAKWLLRRFLVDFSLDIPVNIYFQLTEFVSEEKTNAKGLLTAERGRAKQAYHALQHLTSIFDGRLNSPEKVQSEVDIIEEGSFTGIAGENDKKYLSENPPYESAKSPYPIEIVGLTGDGGDAVTYWLPWRMQEYVKPGMINILLKNVDVKKPVLIDLLTGDIYRVSTEINDKGTLLKDIPIADYPMAIVPRHLVKMKDI